MVFEARNDPPINQLAYLTTGTTQLTATSLEKRRLVALRLGEAHASKGPFGEHARVFLLVVEAVAAECINDWNMNYG